MIYYFNGCMPIFTHAEGDEASFRMITSQMYVNGICKQREIVEAFGVTAIRVKRDVKKYKEGGPAAFFQKKKVERKPRVMTKEVLAKAQEMLAEGWERSEVAKELGIKTDTLYRAIKTGRVVEVELKKTNPAREAKGV